VWANSLEGVVYARGNRGDVRELAANLSGADGIAVSTDGRVFVSRIPPANGLYELDLSGGKPPRTVTENEGGILNAFSIGGDGMLYGPLYSRKGLDGKIVRFDLRDGSSNEVVGGFQFPTAVKLDGAGNFIVAEYIKGEVIRVDPVTKEKTLLATLASPMDNVAIDKDGTIYATTTPFNGVTAINPTTREQRRIVWGELSAPGLLTVLDRNGSDQLLVADAFGSRFIDPRTGLVTIIKGAARSPGTVAIAPKGDAYITSVNELYGGGSVQVRDAATGDIVKAHRGFGAVFDVKVLPDGVLVADFSAGRLVKVADDAANTRTTAASDLEGPLAIASAGDGRFYVSEYSGGRVSLVDTRAGGSKTVVVEGLNRPEGLALTGQGQLVIAEVGRKRVLSVDLGTRKATVLGDNLALGLPGVPHAPEPFLPTGVAVGRGGEVYVTSDMDNVVYVLGKRAP
jgi:sugar lactone lactonase YvrE